MTTDIIIALSTPPGSAALGLIRISGKGCHRMIRQFTRGNKKNLIQKATLRCLWNGDELLDDVVVTLWQKPASYTGEDMAEISCHGNTLIVERILRACCSVGARLARPGEFTERAFLNGKIDLTQAEAVMDLISAKSERALRAAQRIQGGQLGKILLQHRESLLQLLAHLEAYIDFPEEDIQPEVGREFIQKIVAMQKNIAQLIDTADEGRKLREGMRVAIVGAPNSGKSTLLNALLGRNRAIVSDQPGTTRDTVEESILLEGIQVRLIDTAGVRESANSVEQLGIERTGQAVEECDLALCLLDGSVSKQNFPEIPKNKLQIRCITKSDLPTVRKSDGVRISALTGAGLDELKQQIAQKLSLAESPESRELVAVNTRHEILLREAAENLARAQSAAEKNSPPEIISADLRQALRAIGEIVGEATNEDILDRLFANFCIGK